jgi:cytochrome b561
MREAATRYTKTAVIVHWVMAGIVFGQFAFGWLMQAIPKSPPGMRADAFNFHKSVGLCLPALVLFRLGWRLAHPPPLPPMPAWQARAARATHAALYVALVVMPCAGYLGSSWSGYPVKWFGITLPAWGQNVPELKTMMSHVHLATSFVLLSLVVLHVAASLRHALRGDGILARMSLPPSRASRSAARPARRPVSRPTGS